MKRNGTIIGIIIEHWSADASLLVLRLGSVLGPSWSGMIAIAVVNGSILLCNRIHMVSHGGKLGYATTY